MDENYFSHSHTGKDSPKVKPRDLDGVPYTTPTTASATAFSSGGGAVLSTSDATILNNMRTRINELEAILRTMGVII